MDNNANALNWFEIPVADMARAKTFYENIFSISMGEVNDMMNMQMAMFPAGETKVSGALVKSDMHKPSLDGAVIYLNANSAGMDNVIEKIPTAGGSIIMPKTLISPEIGHMAFFTDSEGNRVALHSSK